MQTTTNRKRQQKIEFLLVKSKRMFKFNFNKDENAHEVTEKNKEFTKKSTDETYNVSKLIEITSDRYKEIAENVKVSKVNCFISNEFEIGYLDNKSLTEKSKTDLIPRIYEGGFKIWECTQDLADVFTSSDDNEFQDKTVCELGCSAGILGIIALLKGAKKIDFQDYNEDVLETFTIPNVVLSCEEREHRQDFLKCQFFSGDWSSFNELISSREKYDIILTSETIYNPENYRKLIDFFKSRLACGGKVFLSAKSYYFGVSGNVHDFCKLLAEENVFSYRTIWKSIDGVQRESLLIKQL